MLLNRNTGQAARRKQQDRRANLLLASIIVAATGIGAWTWSETGDGPDNCPSSGPTALLGVVLDSTDALSEPQRLDVTNRLRVLIAELPVGAAVQMWRVSPAHDALAPPLAARMCKPNQNPTGLTSNLEAARRRSDDFNRAIADLLDANLAAPSEPQSPILETIQSVSLQFLNAPEHKGVPQRRLVVLSDLVQNTRELTQLRGRTAFDDFARGGLYSKLGADLTALKVTVLFVEGERQPPASERIAFWQQYFAASGATLEYLHRIVG